MTTAYSGQDDGGNGWTCDIIAGRHRARFLVHGKHTFEDLLDLGINNWNLPRNKFVIMANIASREGEWQSQLFAPETAALKVRGNRESAARFCVYSGVTVSFEASLEIRLTQGGGAGGG